jgi:hypothetical protein
MVLMFQVFVAVLSAAAAIEAALLLKRVCQRWRVGSEVKDSTLAVDAASIAADTAPASEPHSVKP